MNKDELIEKWEKAKTTSENLLKTKKFNLTLGQIKDTENLNAIIQAFIDDIKQLSI